jgi:IS4 transposase
VISDEIVDLGWKSRHRTLPDHSMRLIRVAVKPHAGCRNMRGPTCDGVLRLVTNRLDLPAELIAEMYRLRWMIEMFFRTFKQLLGCGHLFSDKHNGVEIQAYCAMIVCMLILIYTGEKPNRAPASKNSRPSSKHESSPRRRSHGLIGTRVSLLRG